MSSCSWPSAWTRGRAGSTDRRRRHRSQHGVPRPPRLVVRRPAPALRADVARARPGSGSSDRSRAPSTPTWPPVSSRRAAGWRPTSTPTKRRCTSWPASCSSTSAAPSGGSSPGDFTLMNAGVRHALGNTGSEPARWLSLNSPRKQDPESGRQDTFFEPAQDLAAMDARRPAPAVRRSDPAPRRALRGHTAPAGGAGVNDPARGRAPAGMDTRSWPTAGSA